MRFYTDFRIKPRSLISIDFEFSPCQKKKERTNKTVDARHSNTIFVYNNFSFIFDITFIDTFQ